MNLKDAVLAISKNNQEPQWLLDLRLAALNAFEKAEAPHDRDEEWRKINLSRILFSDLSPETGKTPSIEIPKGCYGGNLSQAAKEIPEIVRPYLEESQERNVRKFDALTNALWNGGFNVI